MTPVCLSAPLPDYSGVSTIWLAVPPLQIGRHAPAADGRTGNRPGKTWSAYFVHTMKRRCGRNTVVNIEPAGTSTICRIDSRRMWGRAKYRVSEIGAIAGNDLPPWCNVVCRQQTRDRSECLSFFSVGYVSSSMWLPRRVLWRRIDL